ncbi:MAG: hypothetical protein ACOYB1_09515 [Limnohabitans sp.]
MNKLLAAIAALIVFVLWMRMVGNPHVIETVIGLIIAIAAGIWTARKL